MDHAPLIVVVLEGEVTPEDVEHLRSFYDEVHGRGRRFATLIDVRRVRVPAAPVRRALSDLGKEFEARTEKNTIAVALILESAILAGALRAIQWFVPAKVRLLSFASTEAGLEHIVEVFEKEGLQVPPAGFAAVQALG